MGLSTAEFAVLTPFMFNLKCKGYIRKIDEDEAPFRKLGWITFCMGADPKQVKKTQPDDIWPKRSDIGKKKQQKQELKLDVNSLLAKYRTPIKDK